MSGTKDILKYSFLSVTVREKRIIAYIIIMQYQNISCNQIDIQYQLLQQKTQNKEILQQSLSLPAREKPQAEKATLLF